VRSGSAGVAVLDLDGTLLPGILGRRYLEDLIADGSCHRGHGLACLRSIDRYAAAGAARDQLMAEAYRTYAMALRGFPATAARATATKTWAACRRQLFAFTEELVALLTDNGFRVWLISGNADLPIQAAVADLGLSWGRGATSEIADGYFTGRLVGAPGLPGGKAAIMQELRTRYGYDPSTTIAIGNAILDAEIFELVDHPIAFEADAGLQAIARERGWPTATRATILDTCAGRIEEIVRR